MSRQAFTSSVLRPAWVMQNFTDQHLPVIQDMITVPTAGGAEAFVDAADIAAVAVETLADPGAHAGRGVLAHRPPKRSPWPRSPASSPASPTGPRHPQRHRAQRLDRWRQSQPGAVPPGYGVMLNWLTATIASGHGSRPQR